MVVKYITGLRAVIPAIILQSHRTPKHFTIVLFSQNFRLVKFPKNKPFKDTSWFSFFQNLCIKLKNFIRVSICSQMSDALIWLLHVWPEQFTLICLLHVARTVHFD